MISRSFVRIVFVGVLLTAALLTAIFLRGNDYGSGPTSASVNNFEADPKRRQQPINVTSGATPNDVTPPQSVANLITSTRSDATPSDVRPSKSEATSTHVTPPQSDADVTQDENYNPSPPMMEILPFEMLLEIANRMDDARSLAKLSQTSRVWDELKLMVRERAIFCPKTPFHHLPELIRKFASNIATNDDVKRFADTITPQQAVMLFDRLRDNTTIGHVESDTLLLNEPYEDIDVNRNAKPLKRELVAESVELLIKAVPRVAFTASVLLLPNSFLDELEGRVPKVETLSGIPRAVIAAVTAKAATLTFMFGDWSGRVDRVRNLYPAPFNLPFPKTEEVVEDLLTKQDVIKAISEDPVPVVTALLGVGMRFCMKDCMDKVPIKADIIDDLVPLLDSKHPDDFRNVVYDFTRKGQVDHAIALLRSAKLRAVARNNPSFCLDLIKCLESLSNLKHTRFVVEAVQALERNLQAPE